jgi:hypothetical protein
METPLAAWRVEIERAVRAEFNDLNTSIFIRIFSD